MQEGAEKITEKGATLWAISYDSTKTLEKVKKSLELTIDLLPDPESKVITQYGVLNAEGKGKKEGVAIPTTFVINKDGVIKAVLAHDSVRERHTPSEIAEELEKL